MKFRNKQKELEKITKEYIPAGDSGAEDELTCWLHVPSDELGLALREHRDLLLDVLDLVLGLLEVDDLDGDHILGLVVNPRRGGGKD